MSKNWEIRTVKLSDVKPFDENPRTIDERSRKGLQASLDRFGYVDLIVWNEKSGNIVGGHQRFSLLKENGVEEADMIVVDYPEKEELAANLTLNNPEIEGDWDDPITELLEHVQDIDPELFGDINFDDLQEAVESMVPRTGEDSYEDRNQEVDIDDLLADCDTKCPCCNFEWEADDKDVSVMSEEEQKEISNG
jgi:hypothetical protein